MACTSTTGMLIADTDVKVEETSQLLHADNEFRKPKVPSAGRKAAVLVSAVAIQVIINGLIFGLPVFYPELITTFDSKRSDAVLVQSLFAGICTGGGLLFTSVIGRYGPGLCSLLSILVGIVFFGINLVANSLTMVIITIGVIAGLLMSLCYLTPFVSVSWTFHGHPGVALAVVTVGSSLGQFVVPYLSEIFIQQYRWRGAFLLLAGLAAQGIPFALIIHHSREYFDPGSDPPANVGTKSKCPVDLTLFKDIVIAIILLNCFLLALTGNVEAWFIVDILVSRGFERERGSLVVSIVGLAMFCGRGIGIAMQSKCRIPSVSHWIYLFPLVGIGHALVINISGYSAIVAMCFVTGTFYGTSTSQTPAVMFEASGRDRYPQGMALVNLMYGLGNFFSGLIGGSIRDAYGDYSPMFYLAVAASLCISLSSGIVVCILNRRQRDTSLETTVTYTKLDD